MPLFFHGKVFTSYQVLESRFGVTSRRGASLLFLVTRNVSDALRLFLTAVALQHATGLPIEYCVIGLGIITIIYTLVGGAKAVIWNDCLQFAIYMLGAIAAITVISTKLPGGFQQIIEFGNAQDKFRLFVFDFSLTSKGMTFWAGLVGGLFLTGATHGTDQLMVQRYLSARSQASAAWALVISGFIVMAQFALFLGIGVALACFYDSEAATIATDELRGDGVFAHFIVNYLSVGLVGLTLAGVFAAAMSTLSSSLNSSATALINDIYLPLANKELSDQKQLFISRLATLGFGLVQIWIALASQGLAVDRSTIDKVLMIAGFALGPILGLYLLAVLFKQVGERAALVSFGFGIVILSVLVRQTELYGFWYAACGAAIVVVLGNLLNLLGVDSDATAVGSE